MIFVDTSAWIALLNRKDENHDDAVVIYSKLKQYRERLLTTDYVINDTVTCLGSRHSKAFDFLDLIAHADKTDVLTVSKISKSIFEKAKQLFRNYNGIFSLTECTSLSFCRQHGIFEVFAFNPNLAKMNLVLVT